MMAEDLFARVESRGDDGPFEPDAAPYVAAFVCGAIAGTAVALLFAPASGRDSRAWLTERAGAAGSWAAHAAHARREQVHALIRRYGVLGVLGRDRSDVRPS